MILFASDALSDARRVRKFLEEKNPDAAARAMRAIWLLLKRVEAHPNSGKATKDPRVRQVTVLTGRSGYIVRYSVLADGTIFVTRIWHSREARA